MVVGFTTSDVMTFVFSIHAHLSDTFDRLMDCLRYIGFHYQYIVRSIFN